MKVSDYMTTDVVTANLLDGLRQTHTRMQERNIRHLPVLGDHGELVGIITDRDIRRPAFVDTNPDIAASYTIDDQHTVQQAMSGNPHTVAPGDSVTKALDELLAKGFGALPVVADGELVGMLSAYDLLRAFKDHLAAG